MSFNSWLRALRSICRVEGNSARTAYRHSAAGFRPRLELLEDRTAPAMLTVTTLSDLSVHTGVSLRNAIATANIDAQVGTADTINFDSSLAGGTVLLSQGQLELSGVPATGTALIQIDASGLTGGITIDGQQAQRILYVDGGVRSELDNLTLKNGYAGPTYPVVTPLGGGAIYNFGWVTLSGCHLTGNYGGWQGGLIGGSGGAIQNYGTMVINNSFLTNNYATDPGGGDGEGGGAIENLFGSVTITGGALSGNTTEDAGGAIFNYGGSLMISGSCTLSGNTALDIAGAPISGDGGAIASLGGKVQIFASTVLSGNSAAGNGGAIAIFGGTLTMSNCTVGGAASADGNTAQGNGGGIYINGGTGDITNSTLSNNTANGSGGAIKIDGGTLTIDGTLVTRNNASQFGGGISVDPAVATIISCTFTGNTAPVGADLYNLDSTVTIIASSIANVTSTGGGTVTDPFADLLAEVAALNLNGDVINSLTSKLQAAEQSLTKADTTAAVNQLDAFLNEVNALVQSHRLGEIDADTLTNEVDTVLTLIG
jgi:hypothetical protein